MGISAAGGRLGMPQKLSLGSLLPPKAQRAPIRSLHPSDLLGYPSTVLWLGAASGTSWSVSLDQSPLAWEGTSPSSCVLGRSSGLSHCCLCLDKSTVSVRVVVAALVGLGAIKQPWSCAEHPSLWSSSASLAVGAWRNFAGKDVSKLLLMSPASGPLRPGWLLRSLPPLGRALNGTRRILVPPLPPL